MSPIALMKQNDNTDHGMDNTMSENPAESTLSSDTKYNDLDQQHGVALLGQVRRDKSL